MDKSGEQRRARAGGEGEELDSRVAGKVADSADAWTLGPTEPGPG